MALVMPLMFPYFCCVDPCLSPCIYVSGRHGSFFFLWLLPDYSWCTAPALISTPVIHHLISQILARSPAAPDQIVKSVSVLVTHTRLLCAVPSYFLQFCALFANINSSLLSGLSPPCYLGPSANQHAAHPTHLLWYTSVYSSWNNSAWTPTITIPQSLNATLWTSHLPSYKSLHLN